MSNFTPGQRVTRNADNAHGTVRAVTPDGVQVDMDHGSGVLGDPQAFRPLSAPAELSETVEVTRSYGTTSRGIVTSRDQASDGRVIGYQVWVPGANRYIYADASNVRPLRDTRPAGQRRRPTQSELNER